MIFCSELTGPEIQGAGGNMPQAQYPLTGVITPKAVKFAQGPRGKIPGLHLQTLFWHRLWENGLNSWAHITMGPYDLIPINLHLCLAETERRASPECVHHCGCEISTTQGVCFPNFRFEVQYTFLIRNKLSFSAKICVH